MIKRITVLILFSIFLPTVVYASDNHAFENYLKGFNYQERKDMKINIPEMLQLYKLGKVQIIDVRFREEYAVFSFSFVQNIPLNELPDRLKELDSSKMIITVCPHYDRAEIARTFLTLKGYRSKYLVDGLLGLAEYLRGDKAKEFFYEQKHDRNLIN